MALFDVPEPEPADPGISCCKVAWTIWNPPNWAKDQYKRKVKPRNYKRTGTR